MSRFSERRVRFHDSMVDHNLTLGEKIAAYQLGSKVAVVALLVFLTAISILVFYFQHDSSGFVSNLFLAIATSLMASILILTVDIWGDFRERQNKIFLEGIQKLGIANLHFDKRDLLADLMKNAQEKICFVGYRLILSAELANEIGDAAARGVKINVLITPPWWEAFKMVYGEKDWVMANYVKVLDAMARGYQPENTNNPEARLVNKPLFNDTYIVDNVVITGPYMHNRDEHYGRLAAKDFFTYELHHDSRLHKLILDEFCNLWDDAQEEIDWEEYINRASGDFANIDMTDDARQQRLQQCFLPITSTTQNCG